MESKYNPKSLFASDYVVLNVTMSWKVLEKDFKKRNLIPCL